MNEGRWSRENSASNVSAASVRRGTRTPRNSQASNLSERRSGNMFKNFFAQRNADYRADNAPPAPQYSQVTPRTTAVRRPSSGRSSPPPEQSELEERSFGSFTECLRPSPGFLHAMSSIIGSTLWRVIIIFNTVILLFGSEIQDIWVPPKGDKVMDALFCLALTVFTMDMIMRCYLEPKYVSVPRCCDKESAQNSAWGPCQLGSFHFWCDLLSTLTLLYNISFINTLAFAIETIDISLNDIGIPVSFGEPVSFNFSFRP